MKTLKLVLTSVTMFAVLIAGDESRIGTSGGNQVLVPVGARGIALAGSERVYSSGLESIYWNPAGLARSESPTVLASSMDLFNDMGVNYFGASGNFDKLGMLGVTVKSIDMGDIPVTTVEDMDGSGGGTFKPTLTTMGLTYANSFSDRAFFGVTGKIVYESIPRASASAYALDIGVQYTGLADIDGLGLALVLNNIGTDLHYEGSALTSQGTTEDGISDFMNREASYDKLPSTYNMSLSYSVA
ncbi:MAG: PorV/PorQ family protein, partial [Candidatus Neomarinimicrobiota bacterium]